MIILPFLISGLLGYLLVISVLKKDNSLLPSSGLIIFLSIGLGLGVSGYLGFLSLVLFDHFSKIFVVLLHLSLLISLITLHHALLKNQLSVLFQKRKRTWGNFLAPTLLIAITLITWIQANQFPFGGWDAWSCWNLKARFISLGGHDWKNLLSPLLWRASPHYPLLLPLINAWGWIFCADTSYLVPLLTSVIFTLATAGLLFYGLKTLVGNLPATLGALLIFTLSIFITLATNQYSDILVAFYLLAAMLCILMTRLKNNPSLAFLAGLFLGFLSFSKSEGAVAAVIAAFSALPYLLCREKTSPHSRRSPIVCFLTAFVISFFPTLLFQWVYSPPNQTFINGLFSSTHPVNIVRLKIIFGFFAIELASKKWDGLWLVLITGLLLSRKNCFKRDSLIFPVFFILYVAVVVFYYFINTYFNLSWWLSVTLSRILLTLLPTFLFWSFTSFWQRYEK